MNAPIALFVYNRVEHTRKTLESLKNNLLADESDLYIFSDAPRVGSEEKVREVRKVLREAQWCKNVYIVEHQENKGVDDNVVESVTNLIAKHGKVIVIEDDCVLSRFFLKNMNEALALYADNHEVMHISAYCPPCDIDLPPTFFLQNGNGWGWATWQRAWVHYQNDAAPLYDAIEAQNLFYKFNYEGKVPDNQAQLKACKEGRMKNWDIKWYASMFLKNGLSLKFHPSLVSNIGHDGTGEHSNNTNAFDVGIAHEYKPLIKIPAIENSLYREAIFDYEFKSSLGLTGKIKHIYIKNLLGFSNK